MFVGRVIPNKKFEDVIRAFHVYRTRHNPRSRLLLVGSYSGFERYLAMLHVADRAARHAGRPLPRPRLERGADGALRRRRSLPLRQRARRLLRAAHRERSTSRCRSWPTRRRPCRRRWTAAACSTTRKDPFEIARLMAAVLDDRAISRTRSSHRRTRRSTRLRAKDFAGTLLRFVDRHPRHARRARRPRSPRTSGRMFDQAERLEELRQFRPGAVSGRCRRSDDRIGTGRPSVGSRLGRPSPCSPTSSLGPDPDPRDDHQPVGAGGAPRRRDRRQRAAGARHAAAAWATSRSSSR